MPYLAIPERIREPIIRRDNTYRALGVVMLDTLDEGALDGVQKIHRQRRPILGLPG